MHIRVELCDLAILRRFVSPRLLIFLGCGRLLLVRLGMLRLARASAICSIATRHHLNTCLSVLASRLGVVSTVIFGHYFLDLSVEEALAHVLLLSAPVLLILATVVLLEQAVSVFDVVEGHVLVDAWLERGSKTIDGRLVATDIITIYSEEAWRGTLARFADQSRIWLVRRLEPLAFSLISHALRLCKEENLFARH